MKTIVSVLSLVATLAAFESSAQACTCMSPDIGRSYNGSDHVVHAEVLFEWGTSGGTRWYVARAEEDAFKGCVEGGEWLLVRTPASSAACGAYLRPGTSYLLNGRDAGSFWGMPILGVHSCGYNLPYADLSAEDLSFLHSRYNCCGDECSCTDGSQPVNCFVDPCQVSECNVPGAECRANYCGGCKAEWFTDTGAQVCEDGPVECKRTGCSGQICAGDHVTTTCEWRPEYACYRQAECTVQPWGECGWTYTPELTDCLENAQQGELLE